MARALEYSPTLKGASEHAEAKRFNAKSEHKALYPSIDLAGQYGYFAKYNHFQDFFKKFQHNNASYGAVIRIPVFNSAQKARAAAADQDALIARKQAEDVKDQVSSETLRLQRSLRELAEAKEVARLEHEIAQSDVEAAQARLQSGTATIKDEQQARVREHETYINLLDASFALDRTQMELMRSTGELQPWAIAPDTTTANPPPPATPPDKP
jgi:outer membrane protein TolC